MLSKFVTAKPKAYHSEQEPTSAKTSKISDRCRLITSNLSEKHEDEDAGPVSVRYERAQHLWPTDAPADGGAGAVHVVWGLGFGGRVDAGFNILVAGGGGRGIVGLAGPVAARRDERRRPAVRRAPATDQGPDAELGGPAFEVSDQLQLTTSDYSRYQRASQNIGI